MQISKADYTEQVKMKKLKVKSEIASHKLGKKRGSQ